MLMETIISHEDFMILRDGQKNLLMVGLMTTRLVRQD